MIGYASPPQAVWVTGDALTVCQMMPSASVDLIVCSPPFLALRSYLDADDPEKAKEMGGEATPGLFLDALLDLVVEWRRILTPHGSLCVELGDKFSGSGGAGGDYLPGGLRDGQEAFKGSASKWDRSSGRKAPGGQPYTDTFKGGGPGGAGWPLDKSLCMIPQLFAIALSYGRNPLTGEEIEPWRVRNIVRWCRPNPPVGALGDKFRPATSEMTVACVGRSRYFDLDAVREPHKHPNATHTVGNVSDTRGDHGDPAKRIENHPAGAPPLDYWEIPTHPYKGSHYATFPPALVEKPIKAMCPQRVCVTCGQPSTRITEDNPELAEAKRLVGDKWQSGGLEKGLKRPSGADRIDVSGAKITLGWTDCGHDNWRSGRVLDPFGGSGTTLQVAQGLGRDSIGLDLDVRNQALATERVGPLFLQHLTVEQLVARLTPERTALQAG